MELPDGHACSISTHDPALLEYAHELVRGLPRKPVESEMLRGVEPGRLRAMRDLGYRARTYLPYGEEWYLCHRLAEYPPNVYRALAAAGIA